jgi:D-glycero-alpha-D-manno-heptose-7-phosphate kinase
VAVAFGGLNHILFSKGADGPTFEVRPVHCHCLPELEARLMLVWTGVARTSGEVAESVAGDLVAKAGYLCAMRAMVPDAVRMLQDGRLDDFGDLLAEGWQVKKMVGDVTTPELEELYWAARKAGARGGKLLGAGRGGFMLLYADERVQAKVRQVLGDRPVVSPVLFSHKGAEVVYSD